MQSFNLLLLTITLLKQTTITSMHILQYDINDLILAQYEEQIAKSITKRHDKPRESQYMDLVKDERTKNGKAYIMPKYYQEMIENGHGRLTQGSRIGEYSQDKRIITHKKKKMKLSSKDFEKWYEANEDEIHELMRRYRKYRN